MKPRLAINSISATITEAGMVCLLTYSDDHELKEPVVEWISTATAVARGFVVVDEKSALRRLLPRQAITRDAI